MPIRHGGLMDCMLENGSHYVYVINKAVYLKGCFLCPNSFESVAALMMLIWQALVNKKIKNRGSRDWDSCN